MSKVQLGSIQDGGPDDLPRTIRREKEAREREALAHSQPVYAPAPAPPAAASPAYADPIAAAAAEDPVKVIIVANKVPFWRLAMFFIKCVLAAVPAIALLLVILFGIGRLVDTYMPGLAKIRVLIHVPQDAPAALPPAKR